MAEETLEARVCKWVFMFLIKVKQAVVPPIETGAMVCIELPLSNFYGKYNKLAFLLKHRSFFYLKNKNIDFS